MPNRTRRLLIVAAVTLAVLAIAFFAYNHWRQRYPSRQTYQDMVTAFYSGVLAIEVKDPQHPPASDLTLATQLVPREPAAWADLGLYYLRQGNYDEAKRALDHAHKLAPQNAQIEALLGDMEYKQDHYVESAAHYAQVLTLDSSDLRARYALYQALQRQGGAEANAQARQQIAALFAAAPDNLFVAYTFGLDAAHAGDAAGMRQAVTRLRTPSRGFSSDALATLKTLQKLPAGPAAVFAWITLHNQINILPAFSEGDDAVEESPPGSQQADGIPLEHFLVLPSPSPAPAPPDMALRFVPEPLPDAQSSFPFVRLFSPTPELPQEEAEKFSLPAVPEGPPALLQANGRQLRIAPQGTPATVLPFPGGPKAIPPTPDGVLVADYNYDFKPDIVVAGAGGVRLYQQQPRAPSVTPAFSDVTPRTKLPPAVMNGNYTGVWAADVDTDGDLDLILGSATGPPPVLRNNADGTFTVIHPFPGQTDGLRAFAWGDFDGDGLPDAALIDAHGRLSVFENARGAQFHPWPLPPSFPHAQALAVADVTREETLDLIVLGTDGVIRRLTRRGMTLPGQPDPGWDITELVRWDEAPRDGSARLYWADLDNNGGLDLIATGSGGSRVWLTNSEDKLVPLPAPVDGRALSVADADDKGRLDLVGLSSKEQPIRLVNTGTQNYGWQIVRTRSDKPDQTTAKKPAGGDRRINSFGLGGEVEIRAGLLYEKQPITGPTLHFGLGKNPKTDMIRLLWPNGLSNGEFDLAANTAVVAPQRLNSSCPWLFADDGHGMKFVTDFIWRSPLGLRINAQATAGVVQTQDWVKIRGDQLAARDGFYNLSITADLWETHFFDYLALMTVDHPVGTNVSVDERFSIPPPPLKVYATTPPQPVRKATDDFGHDVTGIVRARDGQYLDTFGRGPYQGITRDHWVELDLGRAPFGPGTPYLVGYGWIHPTDSSINVAISQGLHAPPKPLSLEVPNGHGGWRIARPNLGFPEGKNKTVLLDLSGLFRPGAERRVRLCTNLEIYWDFLGTTTGLPQTPMKIRRLALSDAGLHYRGFSATLQANASSPEVPDYSVIASTAPQWLDLTGFYTRYGDVRPLLTKIDDRYVIMNAGDELKMRFAAPPPPPPGWTRDYVLIGDGWEKDGNFNTSFSQTVLPLPSHSHPAYDTPPGRLEDDPVYKAHRQDWVTYQTRYVTPRAFRAALLPH